MTKASFSVAAARTSRLPLDRINGRVPALLRFLVLAALLVTAMVSMVALAPSQRDAVGRRGLRRRDVDDLRSRKRRPRTPRIFGPLLWLFVDSSGYLRVSQSWSSVVFLVLSGCVFVPVKCLSDHWLSVITDDLERWGRVAFR